MNDVISFKQTPFCTIIVV